ncbi:MAG TPA: hypothetical protein VKA84_12845 [Gemmatimonadaceae bacterium]|nr:hypothetical protein [Gemmatimonadaceae bacterium]
MPTRLRLLAAAIPALLSAGAAARAQAPAVQAPDASAPNVAVPADSGAAASAACQTISSRTSLHALAGRSIRAIDIVTLAPPPLPVPGAAIVDRLHIRTREGTVRRQLLFAPGDTVDTLAVAESMRRLRRQRYLLDAEVVGTICRGAEGVDLTVTTRDEWSTKPSVQLRASQTSNISLTERNLLGTGREASAQLRSRAGDIGVGVSLSDPWLLGTRVAATFGVSSFHDGGEMYLTLGSRERSVLDRASALLEMASTTRRPPADSAGDQFHRTSADLLLTRRLAVTRFGVTALLFGAEGERAALTAGPESILIGPERVDREFAGVSLGASQRSVRYDTLTWLLPKSPIVDIPLSYEGEALFAVGGDGVTGGPALHADLWSGKAWIPAPGSLFIADLWGSGYLRAGDWEAATARAAVGYYRAAPRGAWWFRAAGERLLRPDPDIRALALEDGVARALPERFRLAEAALSLSAERSVHVHSLSRSWFVDAAAFGAGTSRWDAAAPSPEQVTAGVVGVGLRLAPTKVGRGIARLDVGLPVVASADVRRRPYVAIALTPWMGDGRRRDGRERTR